MKKFVCQEGRVVVVVVVAVSEAVVGAGTVEFCVYSNFMLFIITD